MDPIAWIPPNEGEGIRIGLAHGTVEGIQIEEPDYPIARDAATHHELDYIALGHWHSITLYPGPTGSVRMAYPGTHETTKFGERDSGNALIVEIVSPGSDPMVTPVRTGGFVWLRMEEELRAPGDVAGVRKRIEEMATPGTMLLEVQLRGLLWPLDRGEIIHLQEILASRFLWSRLDTTSIRPAPEDESWTESLPPGFLRDAAARLRTLSDPAYPGQRPEGTTPEVAVRALLELYTIIGDGPR